MADEFQAEVCGGSWWNPSRNMFGPSPCSSGISDLGCFGWPSELLDMKARSGDESGSASDGSIVIQDMHKPNQPDSASGSSSLSMDSSSLQILGIGLSSSTSDWNRALLHGNGRSETSYPPMLQEVQNSSMNYRQETGVDCPDQIQKDWNLKNFSTLNQEFSSDQKPLNSIPCSAQGFPISSVSYGYSSTFLQNLFDADPQSHQSLYGNRSMNYPTSTNYQNEFLPSLAKFSPLPANSSLPKQQSTNHLQFLSNTNFCNVSAPALNDFCPNLFSSHQSQLLSSTFSEKPSLPKLTAKPSNEDVQGLGSVAKKTSSELPAFKRPRIETPSPLPTFKVRKEKLGDRITALQQLVSPFGKTDTASVLHEAIECIKYLHDQVSVLSAPYLRNGSPIQCQQTSDIKTKDQDGAKQDLKSRGLCLVPISSTFPVAAENTTDFWTPTFGGTFR